jgi:hypothetical protein
MPATIAERNAILNAYLPGASSASYTGNTSLFLSIHTADPGDTGASEYTGYSGGLRKAITFGAAANAAAVSAGTSAQQDFTAMGATTITHVGLWSANTGGTFKGGGALGAARTTASGDTLRFSAGAVTKSLGG